MQRTKKPDYSLSEGEVLLSPGDARWGALRASKLRGNLTEKKKKGKQLCSKNCLHIFRG